MDNYLNFRSFAVAVPFEEVLAAWVSAAVVA